MPDLYWGARGAATAQRMRQLIKRRGMTGNGHPLWTQDEIDTVKRMVPGYAPIVKKLKRRSYWAVRSRAQMLGLAPRRHVWTAAEISRMRKVYPSGNRAEIEAAFPGFAYLHIQSIASYHGIRRTRRRLKPTGYPIIDQIRDRAFELNYSMVDLDALISSRCTYFQKAGWHTYLDHKRISLIVKELGGTLSVDWDDANGT